MIELVLLIAAFIVFVLVALGVAVSRVNLLAVGLALWVLAVVIGAWPA